MRFATDLFRGHVCRSPRYLSGPLPLPTLVHGQSKIRDVRVTLAIDQDVPWLEITVDEPLLMGVTHRPGDLKEAFDNFRTARLIFLLPGAQVCAVDQFLHDVWSFVLDLDVVDCDKTDMLERGGRPSFRQQHFDAISALQQPTTGHLQRNHSFQMAIVGSVDATETAFSQNITDFIASNSLQYRFTLVGRHRRRLGRPWRLRSR